MAGIVLGAALLHMLATIGLERLPRAHEIRVDGIAILFALAMAVAAGVLLGLMPLTQAFKVNLSSVLHEGGRSGTNGKGARRFRQSLVVAQVGFAFVLLVGAGLLLASFRKLLLVNPGFNTEGVLTASTSAPPSRYAGSGELRALVNRSLEEIRRIPGVAAAGATTTLPLSGRHPDSVILAESYAMEPGESAVSPRNVIVTAGYFEAMNIRLVRGRYFDDRDNETAPATIIVDERLANRFWPERDPIGRRMYRPQSPGQVGRPTKNTRWLTVVGVVDSVRLEDLAGTGTAVGAYYLPYSQTSWPAFSFVVKTAAETTVSPNAVRAAIAGVDPELALFDIRTMAQRRALSLSSRRTSMMLAIGFGALALFLSAIGIYGILAYHVTQRRREIGIRVALGSTRAGIMALVLREGSLLAGVGLGLGIAGVTALRKAIENELYGVGVLDPLVVASVVALLAIVVLAASVFPARRAAHVSPVQVLNHQ